MRSIQFNEKKMKNQSINACIYVFIEKKQQLSTPDQLNPVFSRISFLRLVVLRLFLNNENHLMRKHCVFLKRTYVSTKNTHSVQTQIPRDQGLPALYLLKKTRAVALIGLDVLFSWIFSLGERGYCFFSRKQTTFNAKALDIEK